jgi:hypothetical protein
MEFDRYLIARGAAMATVVLGLVLGIAYRESLSAVPPVAESSGALEAVLLAKPVLIAVRVGVMGLAIYAAASIVGLVIEGRWLVKAGISGAEAEPSVLAIGYQEETSYRFASIDAAIEELREAIDEMEERVYEEDAE